MTIPFIELYDGNVYTYRFSGSADTSFTSAEAWYDIHHDLKHRWN